MAGHLRQFNTVKDALDFFKKKIPDGGLRFNPPDVVSVKGSNFTFDMNAERSAEATCITTQEECFLAWSENGKMRLCTVKKLL